MTGPHDLVLGTAGHIDHGKTALVRALTGVDTDRLPVEKQRGITIDLGFARLDLGAVRLAVVDVPGHERFIRNMVAGATGIDLFLLVIDAAEGARAQTHEHLAILRLLGIDNGVVAMTKSDTVDAETLALAVAEARELVPAAEIVPVSAKTGAGLDRLRSAVTRVAGSAVRPRRAAPTRLYVDRVFTLRGIGTIATGTLWSGSVGEGDELRAEPAGLSVRIRSVQVHDQTVERACAGQRVAVSLPGVARERLRRGDALVQPGGYPLSYRLAVSLSELEPVASGTRLQVLHGTSELDARLVRSGTRFAQLRLVEPVVAARGDRFVLRGNTTLGGGIVLDPAPPRALDEGRFALLERGDPVSIVRAIVHEPVTRRSLIARGLLGEEELDEGLRAVEHADSWYFATGWLQEVIARARRRLEQRARTAPLDPGLAVGELLPAEPWAEAVAPLLGFEQRAAKLYLPGSAPTLGDRADAAEALRAALAAARFDPVRVEDGQLAAYLESEGTLVRLGDGLAVGAAAYGEARAALVEECARAGSIRLARFRDLIGSSRRSAQLLLERFDSEGVTRRIGDERVLRRGASRVRQPR